MTTTMAPEVLADPVGVVVGLVAEFEPALDRAVIASVVASVAGRRAKRRRLAEALLERMIALREAGACSVSPPACAECGKRLRSLHRRGEDWYCGGCGPRPEPCAGCRHTRPVSCRDRDGRPRCAGCRTEDERDAVDLIVDVVTDVDPSLSADVVVAAVLASVPQAGQRRRLAWAVQDRPDLLTVAAVEAPAPSLLRLIDRLCDAGAQKITPPGLPTLPPGHTSAPTHRRAMAVSELRG